MAALTLGAALAGAGLALLAVVLYYVLYIPLDTRRRLAAQGVGGPRFLPLVGINLERMRAHREDQPFRTMHELATKESKTAVIEIGWLPRVFTSDPEAAQDVLSRKARCFEKSPLTRTFLGPFLGNGLVTSEGELWRRQRRAMTPAFRFDNLRDMVELMDCTSHFERAWGGALDAAADGRVVVDLPEAMNDATLFVIAAAAFGADFAEDQRTAKAIRDVFTVAVHSHMQRLFQIIGLVPLLRDIPTKGKRTVDRCTSTLARVAAELVENRRAGRTTNRIRNASGKDLLDLLLEARDEEGNPMARRQLLDEMNTLVLAGHETTSTLLAWTMYELMRAPELWARLRAEVDEHLGADGAPTHERIAKLDFCGAVISEGLRLHPPVSVVARAATEDVELRRSDGLPPLRLRRGDQVSVAIENLHHDPAQWERPWDFWPDRWLEGADERRRKRHPGAYLPFVTGPRSCIGSRFAELEARAILAVMAQRYDFEIVPGQKVVPRPAVTRGFKYGLQTRVSRRRKA